jgi:CubicO group peptidase (beta-lactamase class C family)
MANENPMTELTGKIDTILDAEIGAGEPGAVVAVLRDGEFLHCKSYGLANIEWNAPITPDTVFHIASLTKQFTAVAIMMLKERGLIALDAPLEACLPDFPTRGRRVTVRHLLNHTSGITSYTSLQDQTAARRHSPLADLVARIAALPFAFEPGQRYAYNNSGYVLLGAVIERVSGMKYREFLDREIFRPLGMTRTRYLFEEPIVPRRAAGYQRGRNGIENAYYVSATYYHAAGGLGSNVIDLARWDQAIRGNQLISAETFNEMLEPTLLADGSAYPYGFGWGTADYCGHRVYHHTGGISGFSSHMLHFRDQNLTTILLSNLAQFPFARITRALMRSTLGIGPPCTRAPVPLGAPEPYVGSFKVADTGLIRTLAARADRLVFAEPGGAELAPFGEARFCEANDPETEYVFSALENGRYSRFRFSTPLFPPTDYVRC